MSSFELNTCYRRAGRRGWGRGFGYTSREGVAPEIFLRNVFKELALPKQALSKTYNVIEDQFIGVLVHDSSRICLKVKLQL